jgi:glucuronate isomerase
MASVRDMEQALAEIPVLDAHSHLPGDHLAARGLHDILLYHMLVTELYAAGCPSGARLTQYPEWPAREEAHARLQEALPYFEHIQNTSTFWAARVILAGLYDWRDPVTSDNWRKLDGMIRERADDRRWQREVLDRVDIQRTATEFARRGSGQDDDRLQYVLEWAMFARCQWGEFDTALYELERTWGRPPESPAPIGAGLRQPTERTIQSLSDIHDAIAHYIKVLPLEQLLATAATFSSDIDYRLVSDDEMERALARRQQAGIEERDIYASYINEAFLTALEKIGDRIVYQFAVGAEPLPYETGSRLPQKTIAQLSAIVARHPRLRFQCFVGSRHGNQSLCTLARELPNFSLAGYWWHNFFPDTIRQVLNERLDMVPTNKQIGFFSDAYCVDWAYGKALVVRKQMAQVLAQKIEQGQYSREDALSIARAILYESPQSTLGMVPRAN